MSVSVRLFAHMSQKPHVGRSRNFLRILSMAVARSFYDDHAIRYVLPIFWMTSCVRVICHIHVKVSISSESTMLFDFVVVYNADKLRTTGEVCYPRFPCICRQLVIIPRRVELSILLGQIVLDDLA